MKSGKAIIIGAGPAGLTAALELQRRTSIRPIVLEATGAIGGLARTVQYKGNRMDIGGHRFFSKSDRVMQWWLDLMPVEAGQDAGGELRYRGQTRPVPHAAENGAQHADLVMLVRKRKSRIYFLRQFFDYPLRLTPATLRKMGMGRALRFGLSYLRSAVLPRQEHSLEDFLINRFGRHLYQMFFKSYTEKVWGVSCRQIGAEWGAQRIKGLSVQTAALHFLRKIFSRRRSPGIAQKSTETSLIEKFLYPRLGPGQLWEHVAGLIESAGGEIHKEFIVDGIHTEGNRVIAVEGVLKSGERKVFRGDYFFSSMPVQDLIRAFRCEVPAEVREVSEGLIYRNFIIVGLLVSRLAAHECDGSPLQDNWIYIQDPEVTIGRLQIFNNWSPWLVADPGKVWIGLEFFCNESDPLWQRPDEEIVKLAVEEAGRIGILHPQDVEDAHVERVAKTYPAYFGAYDRFDVVRRYLDGFENLFPVGRNGMHKYNNQDHSMLAAMTAVDNIAAGIAAKENLWAINTEMDYQEEKISR
jgi:protoporphyrinogen oxidase